MVQLTREQRLAEYRRLGYDELLCMYADRFHVPYFVVGDLSKAAVTVDLRRRLTDGSPVPLSRDLTGVLIPPESNVDLMGAAKKAYRKRFGKRYEENPSLHVISEDIVDMYTRTASGKPKPHVDYPAHAIF